MTDRVQAFIVVLAEDMREDDAAQTLAAIQRIKGIRTVEAATMDTNTIVARVRAEREIRQRLYEPSAHLARRAFMSDDSISFRFWLAAFLFVALISGLGGVVVGAMSFTSTCHLAPVLDLGGKYLGPELRCPVPPWIVVGHG